MHARPQPPATIATVTERPPARRTHDRIEAEFDVGVNTENNFYTGFGENISEGGLFVATPTPLSIGEQVSITFRLPGIDTPCAALGIVRWRRDPPAWSEQLPGMGLQFVEIDPATRALVDRFIAKRRPLFIDTDDLAPVTRGGR